MNYFDAMSPVMVEINTESIKLTQKGLGIVINISSDILDRVECIKINEFRFVKDKNNEK